MGFSLELEKNSKLLQNSKMKERAHSPQANFSKYQDKSRVKNHTDVPCRGSVHEGKQNADCRLVQPKSSGNYEKPSNREKAKKNDEFIKYMSDVPSYLQRVETGEKTREKALNVGVLDWSRLEKWHHKQETVPARGSKNAASSSVDSTRKISTGSFILSGADHCKSPAQLAQKVMRFQDFETASGSTLDGQKKKPYKSSSGSCSNEKSQRKDLGKNVSSEVGNPSSDLRYQGRLEKNVRAQDQKPKGAGELQKEGVERNRFEEVTSRLGASSSKLRNLVTSQSTKENVSANENGNTKTRVQECQESAIDLAHHHCPGERSNIVLFLPRKSRQNSLSDVFQTGQSIEADQSKFSGCFYPGKVRPSEIPHSCPLPSRVETTSERDMLRYSQINAQNIELPFGASEVPRMPFQGKNAAKNKFNSKSMDLNLVESPKVLDRATNEGSSREGRYLTPNRRFSFSLGRMSRSSSLKEGSGVPQFSSTYLSTKSGPVKFEASDCLDSLNKEKRNLHNRAKSSPLRRWLDPLLKSKAAETTQPSKASSKSSSFRLSNVSESTCDFVDNEKPVASTIQAFLQLTVKNGLPLFRFVSNDNNHVLAATIRNFTVPEKDDSSENFTFYSVNEIKKKSGGWMKQESKEKKCEYAYNVVGQMKISTLHSSANSNQCAITESVLFGVEMQPEDQDSAKSSTHRELAAVVVKVPNKEDSASTVAILPGGLHSLPAKGVPSPLIDRWRSGGSCDCGGWDMGCKLRVLSNYDELNKVPKISIACPIQERFELFVQEGTRQDKPVFSLAPIKNGLYSITFGSSTSLLQAFFISVAVLNCQKFPDPSQDSREPTLDGNFPTRYVSNPPLSPVGRV